MPQDKDLQKEVLRLGTELKMLEFLVKTEKDSETTYDFLLKENFEIPAKYKEVYSLFFSENKTIMDSNPKFGMIGESVDETSKNYVPQMKAKLEITIKDMETAVANLNKEKAEEGKKLKELSKLLADTKKSLADVKEDNTAIGWIVKMIWTLLKAAMAMALIILGPIAVYSIAAIVASIAAAGIPLMTALTTSSMLGVIGVGVANIFASTVLIWKFVLGAIALIGIIIALASKYSKETAMTEKEKVVAVKEIETKAKEVEKIISKVKSK